MESVDAVKELNGLDVVAEVADVVEIDAIEDSLSVVGLASIVEPRSSVEDCSRPCIVPALIKVPGLKRSPTTR